MPPALDLPDDVETLKRLLVEERAARRVDQAEIQSLKLQLAYLKRQQYGRSSEQLSEKIAQLELTLEDLDFPGTLRVPLLSGLRQRLDMHEAERPRKQPYWRDNWFRSLQEVAQEASQFAAWTDYAAYCTELERGLRAHALSVLDQFVSRMEHASFSDRKTFVSWLLGRIDQSQAANALAPYPLRKRLIEPTLNEWLTIEPLCSEPHRWLGGYDRLRVALQLDPHDEIARRKFVQLILGDVDESAHELPQGYLGNPERDLTLLREAEEAALQLQSAAERRSAISEIRELKTRLEEWLRRR